MAGGPGTLGLWSRHALSEIGVHRMDVEAALGEAYGKHRKSGNPYFWSEKELDHGDKL